MTDRNPWALRKIAPVGLHEAIEHCAKAFGITVKDLARPIHGGNSANTPEKAAYQVTCYVVRAVTLTSFPDLAEALGRADHTSVRRACIEMARKITEDVEMRAIVDRLVKELKASRRAR